jgi:Flp pilus assembly protein TadG
VTPAAPNHDHGSAGVGVVLLTPVVLGLLAFGVLAGRIGSAHQDVVSAAQAAARAASLRQGGSSAAVQDAHTAAAATLRSAGLECVSTAVRVDVSGRGSGGAVTATVSCVVRLSDLADVGIPGQRTVTATAAAPVDFYRGEGG